MSTRALIALLAMAAVALGGCAAKAPAVAPAGATATTGVLQGLVVDGAVHPVAGVDITIPTGNRTVNATTGADGLFRFVGLEPGNYVVRANKVHFLAAQQAVDVHAGVDDPPLAKFVIEFQADSLPFADVYKYDGFYECGAYQVRICSNINIATWVVVCAKTGGQVCLGNVTQDRSLLFQYVQGGLTYLQSELSWDSTVDTGHVLNMLMGGGTDEELKAGVNLPAFNVTTGPSPLVGRVTNHEGPDSWCAHNAPCQTPDTLNSSKIGTERALLVQIDAGPTYDTGMDCVAFSPCGAGFSAQQRFSLYTTAFYRYEPPADWLFSTTGQVPPPPA
jgi:hypothetical protein